MKKTFEEFYKEKFNKGRASHNNPWDAEHVDCVQEIQEELADLNNYSELLKDDDLRREIQGWAKYMYKRIKYGLTK